MRNKGNIKGTTGFFGIGILILLIIILIVIFSALDLINMILGVIASVGIITIIAFICSGMGILFGIIIYPRSPVWGRTITYLSVFGLMIALLFIELSLAGSILVIKGAKNYQECDNLSKTDLLSTITCIVMGFRQTNPSFSSQINLWIFSFIIPLIILVPLFIGFVDASGLIQNKTSVQLIGLGLGFLAYRGFIVSRLIYVLEYGSVGVAMMAINFIFVGGILAYTHRAFQKWKPIEQAIGVLRDTKVAKRVLRSIFYQINTISGTDVDPAHTLLREQGHDAFSILEAETEYKEMLAEKNLSELKNKIRNFMKKHGI